MLDHFREARLHFASRQGQEQVDVEQNKLRLVKRADDVLRHRMVDRYLAADRAVVGKDRRRDLHEADPAHEARRSEAGEIADHASSKGNDRRIAIKARLEGGGYNSLELREGFGGFACGHDAGSRGEAALAEQRHNALQMQRSHRIRR